MCFNNSGALTALQFEFTEGFKTPLFEAKGASERDELKKIKVNPLKAIKKIGVAMFENQIVGIRLVDSRGIYIVNETLTGKEENNKWTMKVIPPEQSIIGLQCGSGTGKNITSLAFRLWSPKK